MLSELTLKNHPNLVRLLATYKFKERYHLLCPYANSNLRMYWMQNRKPSWDIETTLWTLEQLWGLASALDVIHNFETRHPLGSDYTNHLVSQQRLSMAVSMKVAQGEEKYGRHGDLKPENILWFNEFEGARHGGILQIADLGLGRFHSLESRSRQNPTNINGSPTYLPPELALEKLVSRAYDIWSMGCIFLEFITWMLDGANGVQRFADARMAEAHDGVVDDMFYTIYNSGGRKDGEVRTQVTAWILKLRHHRRCSIMVSELLDLVQSDMLRVNSVDRIQSPGLESRLSRIFQRGQSDPRYLLEK
jgi:serine/threonine protein kinase